MTAGGVQLGRYKPALINEPIPSFNEMGRLGALHILVKYIDFSFFFQCFSLLFIGFNHRKMAQKTRICARMCLLGVKIKYCSAKFCQSRIRITFQRLKIGLNLPAHDVISGLSHT
jgi:hypothetical protein